MPSEHKLKKNAIEVSQEKFKGMLALGLFNFLNPRPCIRTQKCFSLAPLFVTTTPQ